jgi:hypothetical protein
VPPHSKQEGADIIRPPLRASRVRGSVRGGSPSSRGLIPPPLFAEPHECFASSTRLTGGLAAPGAAIPGPIPATVAARTPFGFVPEAPYQLRLGNRAGRNFPFVVYTYCGEQGRLLSLVLAPLGWRSRGAFLCFSARILLPLFYLYNTLYLLSHYLFTP